MQTDITVTYRDIPDHPGYRVGSDGSVWSRWVTRQTGRELGDNWRPLKLTLHSRGYLHVNLVRPGGKPKTTLVHRIVLLAFVGPCPPGMEARHFPDRTKTNNKVENLSWGTPEVNVEDNRVDAVYGRGEAHAQAKLTEEAVRDIRRRHAAGESYGRLAGAYNIHRGHVSSIVRRRTWGHVV